jgi:hypothetical protein
VSENPERLDYSIPRGLSWYEQARIQVSVLLGRVSELSLQDTLDMGDSRMVDLVLSEMKRRHVLEVP